MIRALYFVLALWTVNPPQTLNEIPYASESNQACAQIIHESLYVASFGGNTDVSWIVQNKCRLPKRIGATIEAYWQTEDGKQSYRGSKARSLHHQTSTSSDIQFPTEGLVGTVNACITLTPKSDDIDNRPYCNGLQANNHEFTQPLVTD